ncbi:MAG TPA: transglycosylase SLT domain-containing protein [Blastocatellia bacterium]|nr:transglycosylase SLT domain-containing protein [Blastocatellia bacterium]
MGGLRKVGSSAVVLLLSFLLAGTVRPVQAVTQSQKQVTATSPDSIIQRAEETFHRGEEAWAKSLPDAARKMFDESLDIILQSGIDLKADAKLNSYYRNLIERIHKYEAQPGDAHPLDEERVEPSLLDELSEIKDAELAAVTPGGVKIFGKYDFEFSVAPPVFQFINFFAAGRGRSTMEVGLQRSGRYREMVEKIFKEEKVPVDLIWLAQAESVWKPNALSRAAAKGIWQFIPSTGTRYGLAQTAWIDERSHPEKATRAAARYLRWLHDHFAGDWLLAMAAYNSGENRVDSAVAKSGYADFWELYKRGLLPQETRNYVPCILSIIVISKNQKRYGFDVKPDPTLNFESFEVPGQTDLKVVADLIGVPYEVIQDLNPELRRGTSPLGQRYAIKLPKGMKKQFEVAYADLPEEKRVRKVIVPADDIADGYRPAYRVQMASHRVGRGETLASLARQNRISVQELARLNRMSTRGELRKGQTIKIPQQVRASRDRRGTRGRIGRYREMPVVRSHRGSRTSSRGRAASPSQVRRHHR